MKKLLLKTLAIICILCSCSDSKTEDSNFSKILIGEWKIRLYNYENYGLAAVNIPPCAWKKTDGIYFKYTDSRILFRNDGTYSMTLDTLCEVPGFSWDTVAYKRSYSVSGDRIKGLCGDFIWGPIKKKGLKDSEGVITRDSIYKTGSVDRDSIFVDHFKEMSASLYTHNDFTHNVDCSIITDKFARDDTSAVRPFIYIRINKIK